MGLWEVLRTSGAAQDVANVERLVTYAAGKLTLVRETFPDYTMHDRQHAGNVVALVERLLGPHLGDLSALEAAMLVLAAYFHDIGMVYSPEELAELLEEEDFRQFLNESPEAYVRVRQLEEIPRDVVVEYCRARHAQRVSEHLFQLDAELLKWDDVGIAEGLAALCQSHNEPLEALRSEKFSTTFLGACDLRMCAVLLRLADILDLDQTRSPAAVYDHLQLARTTDGVRGISNVEWSKHLAARGFRFPERRTPNYPLLALASPRRPAVEHAIRKFLDVVDEELRGCRILLDFCDDRWKSLVLPGSVDRSGIVSNGYRYGEYRFSLDRRSVLRLFMGDQLYGNPYVFIRELLQNALDACRLGVYLHDAEPEAMEVRVSAWEDEGGSFWVRVDDSGVGMDQDIVERYFLGVGRSYYRSQELQADLLRKNKTRQQFVAISRFGIGVLSSFIVGDRVEVSTRRRLPDGRLGVPLRLSLDSLDDFFVVQEQPMVPAPFPSRTGREAGYRKGAGTSVAVRIDPIKADVSLEQLLTEARAALHYPPVRVFLNDVEQQDLRLARLDRPMLPGVVHHRVSAPVRGEHQSAGYSDGVGLLKTTEVTVVCVPLDLTRYSPTPALRGQLIAVDVEASGSGSLLPLVSEPVRQRMPASLLEQLDDCIVGRSARVSVDRSLYRGWSVRLHVECTSSALRALSQWLQANPALTEGHGDLSRDVQEIYDSMGRGLREALHVGPDSLPTVALSASIPVDLTEILGGEVARSLDDGRWLGHNGTSVRTRSDHSTLVADEHFGLSQAYSSPILVGPVALFDHLRPDVSVSRDAVRSLDFAIRSALHLGVRRAAAQYSGSEVSAFSDRLMWTDLLEDLPLHDVTQAEVAADPLLAEWRAEGLLRTGQEPHSVQEIRRLAADGPVALELPLAWWTSGFEPAVPFRTQSFYALIGLANAERELDLELTLDSGENRFYVVRVRSSALPVRPAGLAVLPVFTAVPYSEADVLVAPYSPTNLTHPTVGWFVEHAAALKVDYPALFAQFMRALAMASSPYASSYRTVGTESPAKDSTPADAARLLNATLDRIRRTFSATAPPPALSVEVHADEEGALRSAL